MIENQSKRTVQLKEKEEKITQLVKDYYSGDFDREACKKEYFEAVLEYWLCQHNLTIELLEKKWIELDKEENKKIKEKSDIMAIVMFTADTCLNNYDCTRPFIYYLNSSLKFATMNMNFDHSLYKKNEMFNEDNNEDSKYCRKVWYNCETSNEDSLTEESTDNDELSEIDSMNSHMDSLLMLRRIDRLYNCQQARSQKYISLFLTNLAYGEGLPYKLARTYSFFDYDLYYTCCNNGKKLKDKEIAEMVGMTPSNYNRAISNFRDKLLNLDNVPNAA